MQYPGKEKTKQMNKSIIAKAVLVFLAAVCPCRAGCSVNSTETKSAEPAKVNPVDEVLTRLKQQTQKLEYYQADVEYLFKQPLFESQTLRRGVLYYSSSAAESKLRVNFKTLKQDDAKEQKYVEQYIVDGIWLTYIDYQVEAAKRYRLVGPNEPNDANQPTDAFSLVSRDFPIIGFSKTEDLKKEFEIELVTRAPGEQTPLIQLHLKVKPDSVYKDDYTSMDFCIDRKTYLPTEIIAATTEEDIYDVKFLKPKINKRINDKVFEFRIPDGFSIEEKILNKAEKNKSGPS